MAVGGGVRSAKCPGHGWLLCLDENMSQILATDVNLCPSFRVSSHSVGAAIQRLAALSRGAILLDL